MKKYLVFAMLLLPILCFCQTTPQDSLLRFLTENKADVQQMVADYKNITFSWKQFLVTIGGVLGCLVLTWKLWAEEQLKNYIRKKSEEAIDSMLNLKTAKILILSNGNDSFLNKFFKVKGFPNVKFVQVKDKFVEVPDFDYELVFANNENGELDLSLVREYVEKANSLLFYFGKSIWDYSKTSPELSLKINFANSRAQIYGNLMSSLEFLELTTPKIKNI